MFLCVSKIFLLGTLHYPHTPTQHQNGKKTANENQTKYWTRNDEMRMSMSKSKSIYIEIRKWKLESRKWNGIIVLNVKRMKWWWNQNRKSKHIYYKLLDAHDEHAEKPTNINKNWRRIPKKINKKWIKESNTRILCVCVWAYSSFLPWWVWFFFLLFLLFVMFYLLFSFFSYLSPHTTVWP